LGSIVGILSKQSRPPWEERTKLQFMSGGHREGNDGFGGMPIGESKIPVFRHSMLAQ
jgi:hypothetical protein